MDLKGLFPAGEGMLIFNKKKGYTFKFHIETHNAQQLLKQESKLTDKWSYLKSQGRTPSNKAGSLAYSVGDKLQELSLPSCMEVTHTSTPPLNTSFKFWISSTQQIPHSNHKCSIFYVQAEPLAHSKADILEEAVCLHTLLKNLKILQFTGLRQLLLYLSGYRRENCFHECNKPGIIAFLHFTKATPVSYSFLSCTSKQTWKWAHAAQGHETDCISARRHTGFGLLPWIYTSWIPWFYIKACSQYFSLIKHSSCL